MWPRIGPESQRASRSLIALRVQLHSVARATMSWRDRSMPYYPIFRKVHRSFAFVNVEISIAH